MTREEQIKQAALVEMQDSYFMLGFNAAIEKAESLLYEFNRNNFKERGRNCVMIDVQAFKKAMKGE